MRCQKCDLVHGTRCEGCRKKECEKCHWVGGDHHMSCSNNPPYGEPKWKDNYYYQDDDNS